mmetsp:Transcript_37424/g.99466  ORF Transcript_37424/g.99466 Transcript_37424/m.99466 type:complete len:212 (+) Transcript_37424:414-1049(+)
MVGSPCATRCAATSRPWGVTTSHCISWVTLLVPPCCTLPCSRCSTIPWTSAWCTPWKVRGWVTMCGLTWSRMPSKAATSGAWCITRTLFLTCLHGTCRSDCSILMLCGRFSFPTTLAWTTWSVALRTPSAQTSITGGRANPRNTVGLRTSTHAIAPTTPKPRLDTPASSSETAFVHAFRWIAVRLALKNCLGRHTSVVLPSMLNRWKQVQA